LSPAEQGEVRRMTASYRFFHWHLAFPEVSARGGFDVVLGNPPWEHTELKDKVLFADRSPVIANARTGAERKRLIAALLTTDPALHRDFCDALRDHDGLSHLLGNSGRYPFCGRGRINLYAVFAEGMRSQVNDTGRVGCVLPSGIATDDTTKLFFQDLVDRKSLVSLFSFENEDFIFPAVHHATRFCLLTAGSGRRPTSNETDFVFFARQVSDIGEAGRHFTLSAEDIARLNPNTRTCPIFRSRLDAELTKSIYRRVPVLIREAQNDQPEENAWGVRFRQGLFNMTSDSHLFRTRGQLEADGWQPEGNIFKKGDAECLPLYEAKMIHHFDHRWGTYEGQTEAQANQGKLPELDDAMHSKADLLTMPRYWVSMERASAPDATAIGFRRITGATVLRTFVGAIVPRVGFGDSVFLLEADRGTSPECLCAALSSFAFDYVTRQKMGGLNMSFYIVQQLPAPRPNAFRQTWPCSGNVGTLADWLLPRVLELTYTAWDLAPFAQYCGWSGPPFRWDPERRFMLRCELDAAFFHTYLGSSDEWRQEADALKNSLPTPRDAVAHIMETFPLVKQREEGTHGEYRTKRMILEIYDEMQRALDTGRPYQTRLDPPPADLRVTHGAPRAVAVPTGPTKVLPFRRLGRVPKREERYETAVPLLTLKAAAGTFGEIQDVEFDEWVELANPPQLQKGMFLAQVTGRSMEPEIPEGSYCLFRYVRPGSREGKVVLVQLHGHSDPESGGSYTVKRYHGEKERDEDGGWRHARIVLTPTNPDYEPIVFGAEDEGEVKVVAELVKVL